MTILFQCLMVFHTSRFNLKLKLIEVF